MADYPAPEPQPGGALGPPGRRPPTAIAAATLPPPRSPEHAGNILRTLYWRVYAFAAVLLGVGALLVVFSPWPLAVRFGLVIAGMGALFALMTGWIHTGAAARWALWRRTRWIRKRQRTINKDRS